jgi:hypothetical protein
MLEMKILWLSELGTGSSFSRVTEEMATELHNLNHNIQVISKHPEVKTKYTYVFKTGYSGQIPNNEIYDVLIFLGSTDDAISMIRLFKDMTITLKCCYCPIEFKNNKCEQLNFYDKIFTMTHFGKQVINIPSKTSIINHGSSPTSFFKINRKSCRERCRECGINIRDNDFVIFNGNRNEYRKRLDLTIQSFLKFKETVCPNAKLLLHCGNYESNDPSIIMTSKKSKTEEHPNFTSGFLNIIYNACDIGINTSMGEGWGLVSFEMASLGIPQVVPNFSSYPEIFGGRQGHELLLDITEQEIGWCGNEKENSYKPVGGVISVDECVEKLKKIHKNYNTYYLKAQKNFSYFGSITYKKVTLDLLKCIKETQKELHESRSADRRFPSKV